MTMNQREKNIERLQIRQRELVKPARIIIKSPIDEDVNKFGKLISAVSLQPMIMKSQREKIIKSQREKRIENLKESQKILVKKNRLNFSMMMT